MVINLGLPVLILAAPMYTMQTFLPSSISCIGQIIYGIILFLVCLYCMFGDFIHIVRLFNSTFLGSFGDIFDLDLND